jgi:hypothetical protein
LYANIQEIWKALGTGPQGYPGFAEIAAALSAAAWEESK